LTSRVRVKGGLIGLGVMSLSDTLEDIWGVTAGNCTYVNTITCYKKKEHAHRMLKVEATR
jgi:hypothetical protein